MQFWGLIVVVIDEKVLRLSSETLNAKLLNAFIDSQGATEY